MRDAIAFLSAALILGAAVRADESTPALRSNLVAHQPLSQAEDLDEVDQWLEELDDLVKREDWMAVEALARKVIEATSAEKSPRRMRGLIALGHSQANASHRDRSEAAYSSFLKAAEIGRELVIGNASVELRRLLVQAVSGAGANSADHRISLRLFEESATLCRDLYSADNPNTAAALVSIGFCLDQLGRSSDALLRYEEAVAMYRRRYTQPHRNLAFGLRNLGLSHLKLGNHSEALLILGESLAVAQHVLAEDLPSMVGAISNYAGALETLGRYPEARIYFERAEKISRSFYLDDHPYLALSIASVADILSELEESSKGQALYDEALAMLRRIDPEGSEYLAVVLGNYAHSHCMLGSFARAQPIYEESLAIYRRLYDGSHPSLEKAISNLALVHSRLGDTSAALQLGQESLEMRRLLFSVDHPRFVDGVRSHAHILERAARHDEARVFNRSWISGVSSVMRRSSLSWEAGVDLGAEGYAVQIAELPKSIIEAEYGLVSEARFFLREAASLSRAVWTVEEDQAVQELRHTMLESKAAAERAVLSQHGAEAARQKADADLVRYSQALQTKHGDRLRLKAPSLAELGKALGKDALAVDIYRKTDREKPYYLAVILDAGVPKFEELGSEAQIESALSDLSISFAPGSRGADAEEHLNKLDQLTLGKLEPYLKGKSKLYLAVDGALAQVPFAALVSGTSPDSSKPSGKRWRYRVEDLQIGIVPSVLDLAAKSVGSGATGAVLVGDVDFDAVASRPASQGLKHTRMIQPPTGTLGSLPADGKWPALSSKELDALKELPMFKQAVVLSGAEATEAALREKVRAPRYLHFFTHGFFTPKKEPEGKSVRLDQIASADDPMYRSALVLAGANADEPGPPQDDGYLMAAEATRLDLRGTRLVTLAACESGLGDHTVGQGVLGLRRAFRAAGAQGVVMSLYQVPDSDTAELMTALYGALGRGQTAPAALRQAQLELLRSGKGVYRWGLFVYEGFEK